jgi:FkbM family methyltransferase
MIGDHSGIARGVLVEPLPRAAAALRLQYPAPTFTVVEGALDATSGPRDFHVNGFQETSSLLPIHRGMSELSGIELGAQSVIECQAYTLREVLTAGGIEFVDLLKLDVQGKEDDVLAGAGASLGAIAMIWTEVSFKRLYQRSCTFFDVHARLTGAGFALMAIEPGFRAPDGELLQADALFVNQRVRRGGPRGGTGGRGER